MRGKYYISSFFWSTCATLLRAVVNFVSVPILLKQFGIDDYGVLTLAISTNAYIALMDVGGNNGPIKFFSEWLTGGQKQRLTRVAGTSLSFYLLFGVFNAALLLALATWGEPWFKLTHEQFELYKVSLYIIALFSVFNWCTHVFSQLIISTEKISFTKQIDIIIAIATLLVVFITVQCSLSLNGYFFLYTIVQSSIVVPYFLFVKRLNLVDSLTPKWYWKDFYVVLKYSLALFAMSIFQMLAAKSRPLILGIFADNAATALGEYRIIEVFPTFLISMCGALTTIFLPRSSRYVHDNDKQAINSLSYDGSRITAIFSCLICFPVLINSQEILTVYVGKEYAILALWLALWCFTLVLNLYNSPIASLILATGKTKMLVLSSAFACIVSMIINIVLCRELGVGSAVIGYLIYILIQQLFYFLYFDNKVLGLNSLTVLKSFGVPVLGGAFISVIICYSFSFFWDYTTMTTGGVIAFGIAKGISWLILFTIFLFVFSIISKSEIRSWIKS